MTNPLLEMRGITKRFPGVLANDRVDFDVAAGEVHALLGENGAGKSTLMKMLYGMMQPDAGSISVNGSPIVLRSPTDAISHGIGMVHQHFMLVPTLTVAENVALGLREGGPVLNLKPLRSRLAELSESYGLKVDPDAHVWQLAVGERQRVEILKSLYRNANLLVLDEPTAVLHPDRSRSVLYNPALVVGCGQGHCVHQPQTRRSPRPVPSGHRAALRSRGRLRPTAGATRQELAHLMVGRDVRLAPDRPPVAVGPVRLQVSGLTVAATAAMSP